ncbi:MAG: MBL fold metallo-hydrolase [Deferrisomatales bacterium]
MIFRDRGEVVPGFHALGSAHTPSYLLDGPRPALFDSGFTFLSDAYADHARQVLGGREPELLFLTHAHFDHCGGAGALRRAFPGLRIAASPQAAAILQRPRALELIRTLNAGARGLAVHLGEGAPSLAEFEPFEVDLVLQDGDEVDLGDGVVVQVLATPGHTRDFLSYYVPSRKILIASEAVGCADASGQMIVEFVADYDDYLASIRRMSRLDVRVLCQGHLFVYVGDDVPRFFERTLRETEQYRRWVEGLLDAEGGDVARVVAQVKAAQYDPIPQPKQPLDAYLLNTEARVRGLAARPRRGDQ